MTLEYTYPEYGIDLSRETMQECRTVAIRLLHEVGFLFPHDRMIEAITGKPGIRIEGQRIYFEPATSERYLEQVIAHWRKAGAADPAPPAKDEPWKVRIAGVSMNVLDIETDEPRLATCQDLRDGIKLVNSFGVGGNYPVMPQDVPPLMREVTCGRICHEMGKNIYPSDYQHPRQARYMYEMHRVMGQKFNIGFVVPSAMAVDPNEIDVFFDFYEDWKKNKDITFCTYDYAMGGITKPVTVPGCATMILAETLAVHMVFNMFDPELNVPVGMHGSSPTDMRNACWAFGVPNAHLFTYLSSRLQPWLCGYEPKLYRQGMVRMETASAAVDEQAGIEKLTQTLIGAMQGARSFHYAGALCVDDLFSPVQFVIDMEMIDYVRQVVEAFDPHPDIASIEGLYEECRDVSLDKDMFISHPNTVSRFRNILSDSKRMIREKLPSWFEHHKLLKDRAKEEAIERIKTFEPEPLPADKQKELDSIYQRALAELTE